MCSTVQVGQGACHFQYAVCCTQAQSQSFAGVLQPLAVFALQAAMLLHAIEIEVGIGAALASQLLLACLHHLLGQFGAAWAGLGVSVQSGGFPRHAEVQVDAVEQRAGEFAAVALDLFSGTAAAPGWIAQMPAGARIHRRHQLKARRKTHFVACPSNHDLATFNW